MKINSRALFLIVLLNVSLYRATSIRGVPERDIHLYQKEDLACPSTGKALKKEKINDGICDCPDDGFDEPGTAACQAGHFFCKNTPNLETTIESFKVNDGVCDCCDGSDEYLNLFGKPCPNTCEQEERNIRRTAYLERAKNKKAKKYYEKSKSEAEEKREELKQKLVEINSKLIEIERNSQIGEAKVDDMDEFVRDYRIKIEQLEHLITNLTTTKNGPNSSSKPGSTWKMLIDTKLKKAKDFISGMSSSNNVQATTTVTHYLPTIVTKTVIKYESTSPSDDYYYDDKYEKDELLEKIRDIETVMSSPNLYGPDSVFLPLKDRCFDSENGGFTYTLCWFGEVKQDNGNTIGKWTGKWGEISAGENGEVKTDYKNMFYEDGDWCGSKARETQVVLKCGWSDQIISVEEPSKCFYLIEFSTPLACIL